MGHGFMMAPVVGKLIAEQIAEADRRLPMFERWNLRRFKEGKLLSRGDDHRLSPVWTAEPACRRTRSMLDDSRAAPRVVRHSSPRPCTVRDAATLADARTGRAA